MSYDHLLPLQREPRRVSSARRAPITAASFAARVCAHMAATGHSSALYEHDGAANVCYAGSKLYSDLVASRKGRKCVIGYYTPAIPASVLAADIEEYFA